jgi:hypothetical protein
VSLSAPYGDDELQSAFETAMLVVWSCVVSALNADPDASRDASPIDLQAIVHVRSPAICSLDPNMRRGTLQRNAGHTTSSLVAIQPLAFVPSPSLLSNHPFIVLIITAMNA